MSNARPFLAPDWRAVFLARGLDRLDAWQARVADRQHAQLVDEPNRRYGGELSVYRVKEDDGDGRQRTLYVKCQRDQHRRTLAHPFGEPTLVAEFRALRRCLAQGIPVAPPVFFESRRNPDGHRYTVMVSLGLDGFESLDRLHADGLTAARRRQLIADVARTLAFMHGCRYAHRNLYPKHVFVAWRPALQRFDVRFIDMEKTHRAIGWRHRRRDLESLAWRSSAASLRDRLRFLRHYLGRPRLGGEGKALARQLAKVARARKARA